MREQKQNNITTIIGHKGDGKTVLTEILTVLSPKPAIIADPREQFDTTDIKRRLYFRTPQKLRIWLANNENFNNFYLYKLELVCKTTDSDFEKLTNTVNSCKSLLFVVDEVDMFFDTHASNKNGLYKLVHYGRHSQIDIMTTSRRPSNISRNLTAMTDTFYFSKLTEPADVKYYKDTAGEKYLNIVQNLKKYTFLKVDDNRLFSIVKTTEKDIEIIDKL
jgi:energy-coupling factor transporter ATP-binding protein EcfA2